MSARWLRKEGILPVVLGLAVLAAASYLLLFVPELRTIRSLRAQIAARDAEVAGAMKLRAEVEQSRAGEGAQWEDRLRAWERKVPSSPDNGRLLSEIGEMAVRHRLAAFGLTVAPAGAAPAAAQDTAAAAGAGQAVEGAVETRYRITFRSTYRDLAEFLDGIPRAQRMLTIRSVSVKERTGAMVAEIEVSAWHRRPR